MGSLWFPTAGAKICINGWDIPDTSIATIVEGSTAQR